MTRFVEVEVQSLVDFLRSTRSEDVRSWLVLGAVFLGLNVLLHVPDLYFKQVPAAFSFYLSDPTRLYYLFSLDLFCLLSLMILLPKDRVGEWVYDVITVSILLLLLYQTYDGIIVSTLHRSPIFYADVSHVVGAIYLALNTSIPWPQLAMGVGLLAAVGLLMWRLPSLLRTVHRRLFQRGIRWTIVGVHVVIWPLVALAALTDRGIERQTYQEVCLSTMECVAYNVKASIELRRQARGHHSEVSDSTYASYRSLNWSHRPSLYVVVLESYGSVLAQGATSRAYQRLMGRAADTLESAGWHLATAESEAPVSGGLSWLSVATVLMGTTVSHQPTFDVLRSDLSRYPHLVWLLEQQGYRTAILQPPVRPRPGMHLENLYGFDRTLYLEDLNYHGPDYGWGIVPDQYSLAVAHEQFVEEAERPFFLLFETATSHGRWDREPPPVVKNPTTLNQPTAQIDSTAVRSGVLDSAVDMTHSDASSQAERLLRHIRYDWRVLVHYLRTKAPRNSLVVVVGDHQPYFAKDRSFATPLHVLSRDRTLIRRFRSYGFIPGLQPSRRANRLHHAGMYSLLVRVLTAHDRSRRDRSTEALPPYHPRGIEWPSLLDSPLQELSSDRS